MDTVGNYFLSSTLNHYITESGEKGTYTCLPFNLKDVKIFLNKRLNDTDTERLYSIFPHLSLKRVMIGWNVDEKKANNIKKLVELLVKSKLEYQIDICESIFKKDFV
jgi:hypothetical protein